MDPTTQVTSVHGHSVLDLALQPLRGLLRPAAGARDRRRPNDRAMLDVAVAAEVNLVGDPILVAADAARDAGNAPERGDGGGGGDHRPEAGRAGAGLHPGADRPLRAFGPAGRPRRGRSTPRRSVVDDATRALFLATPDDEAGRSAARGDAAGDRGARRQVGVPGLPAAARRAAVARRDPRRHRDDDRLGAADAQAHHPADRRDAALVPAALRRDGRAPRSRASTTSPARCAASRATSASGSGRWPTCASSR